MRPKLRILIAMVLALAAAGVFGAAWVSLVGISVPRVTTSGTALIGGPFILVSMNGDNVTDQTYRGKWPLMFFGYTFCPDACPMALNNISIALEKLGADASKLQPLFVTVDPQRDTREVLKDYLKSFDSRIIGLTGTQNQIDRVVKQYRVYAERRNAEGDDNYPVSHSAYIYLMDPQGKFINVIQGSEPGEEIAAWVRKQMAHPDS